MTSDPLGRVETEGEWPLPSRVVAQESVRKRPGGGLVTPSKSVRFANDAEQRGFTMVPNALLEDTSLSAGPLLTWIRLAYYARRGEAAWPGQERLGEIMGIGDRQLRRHLKDLEGRGLLRTVRRGLGHTNGYLLFTPSALADRQEMSGSERTEMSGPDPALMSGPIKDPEAEVDGVLAAASTPSVKKTPSSSSSPGECRPEIVRLCELLAELMLANDPKARVAPRSAGWLDACRLLLDRDGRSVEEVERVIRFTQADDFERANVLSMPKLRQRFGQLLLKAQRHHEASSRGSAAMLLGKRPEAPACPGPVRGWAPVQARLRGLVRDDLFALWLDELHSHGVQDGRLVVAAPAEKVSWVQDRFLSVLERAAGQPVRVVACSGSIAPGRAAA